MTMIRVVFGDNVVTWSPEYGFTVAGPDHKLILTEEVEPRVVYPPTPLGHLALVPQQGVAEEVLDPPREPTAAELAAPTPPDCFTCDHPAHPGRTCTWELTGPDVEPGRTCDCLRYVV